MRGCPPHQLGHALATTRKRKITFKTIFSPLCTLIINGTISFIYKNSSMSIIFVCDHGCSIANKIILTKFLYSPIF